MQPIRSLALPLVIPFLALLAAGCVKASSAQPEVDLLDAGSAETADRSDCGEIYGTAYRSQGERAWFQENCSDWPLIDVPPDPPAAAVSGPLPPECNQIRGRPYESQEQRRWYLENCLGNNRNSAPQAQEGDRQQGGSRENQDGGENRANCDSIRGTQYRSSAERAWYAANCGAGQPTTGPDRTSCTAIRGTTYRSDAERDWFQRNCLQGEVDDDSDEPPAARGNDRDDDDEDEDDERPGSSNRGRGRDN